MRSILAVATALSLCSTVYSAVSQVCPKSDVCYSLNIPSTTANSGNGSIYFQLSAPTTYSWIALGQGSQMAGANIFVIYTSADGANVTVSPRLGTGHVQPQYGTSASIEILDGSGVSGGLMVANVKCSNCQAWNGGSMDFQSGSGQWIYAFKSGSPLDSDSLSESITQHDIAMSFSWNLAQAKGGNSVNPFVSTNSTIGNASSTPTTSIPATCTPITSSTLTGSGCPTAMPSEWPTARPTWAASCFPSGHPWGPPGGGNGPPPWVNNNNQVKRDDGCPAGYESNDKSTNEDGLSQSFLSKSNKIRLAHAVLACLAWVGLAPIGGILIRLADFTGLIWIHAAIQLTAYVFYVVAFGMGIYLATHFHALSKAHPIIGIAIFAVATLQPLFGYLHHKLYKKYNHRSLWSYVHIWHGRALVILGMINGGLGLQLAGATRSQYTSYAVIAGIMGVLFIAAAVVGERRRKKQAPPSYEKSQELQQWRNSGSSSEDHAPRDVVYAKRAEGNIQRVE